MLILENVSTDLSPEAAKQTLKYIKEGLPSLSKDTLHSFVERNAQPGQLSADMNLGMDYILLTSKELSEISSQPNWGRFLRKGIPARMDTIKTHPEAVSG